MEADLHAFRDGRIQLEAYALRHGDPRVYDNMKLVIDGERCTVGTVRIGRMSAPDYNEVYGGYRQSISSQIWDILRDADGRIVARAEVKVGSRSNPNYFTPDEIQLDII